MNKQREANKETNIVLETLYNGEKYIKVRLVKKADNLGVYDPKLSEKLRAQIDRSPQTPTRSTHAFNGSLDLCVNCLYERFDRKKIKRM